MKVIIFIFVYFLIIGDTFCQKKFYNTSINKKLYFFNTQSTLDIVGDPNDKIVEGEGLPRINFVNNSKTYYIVLYGWPGINHLKFAEFEIGYIKYFKDTVFNKLNFFEKVKTESGVRLGMTLKQFVAIKGKSKITSRYKGLLVLSYQISNPNSILLKKYNVPKYESKYYFKKGKLVKFRFGFPYL